MKLYIPQRTNLNERLLKDNFEIVTCMKDADIVITQSTMPEDFDGQFNKIIYVAVEPPLADHRLWCYSNFDKFNLVVRHNPDSFAANQIPFTESDEPQYYPTRPNPDNIPQYTRVDTTLTGRGVYYAGMIGPYEMQPDSYGGINLTKLRRQLGEYLKANIQTSKIVGIGWENQVIKVSDWRIDKSNQIRDSGCDFVLALENTMLPNYLYEKIWDGFASDRVTLYLGDSRVEKHIPLDCFIDLRDYFNPVTKTFDFDGLKMRLLTITQEEYNTILSNARKFRETAKNKHQELQDALTLRLIKHIKDTNI